MSRLLLPLPARSLLHFLPNLSLASITSASSLPSPRSLLLASRFRLSPSTTPPSTLPLSSNPSRGRLLLIIDNMCVVTSDGTFQVQRHTNRGSAFSPPSPAFLPPAPPSSPRPLWFQMFSSSSHPQQEVGFLHP